MRRTYSRGPVTSLRAFSAPQVACATCHVDHRGESVKLAEVDDRECGACHRVDRSTGRSLTSLARHPEFALVRSGTEVGSGLRWFNHDTHLGKVREKLQKGCEACHERGPGAAAFTPIVFADRCAGCHEDDLAESAAALTPAIITALGPLPPNLQLRPDPDDPGRQVIAGIKHADAWVLRTVQSLRMAVNPEGFAADRLTLDREVAQLELMKRFTPRTGNAGAWGALEEGLPLLRDGPPPGGSGSLEGALQDTAAAVQAFTNTIVGFEPSAKEIAEEARRAGTSAFPAQIPAGDAIGNGSVQQVRQLLDATIARARAANNAAVVDRASALAARVDRLLAAQGEQRRSLRVEDGFDALLRDLRAVSDPGVRTEVGRAEDLARMARQQSVGGIDPTAFDLHRQRTLLLLEAVQASARRLGEASGPVEGLRARASAMQREVLSAIYGLPPELARARASLFRERQADRARVDSELEAAGLRHLGAPPPPDNPAETDRRLVQLRRRLDTLGSAQPLRGAVSATDARTAIAALLGREAPDAEANALRKNRCTLCHELTPAGDQLAPLRLAGGALLVNARFTHQPHLKSDTESQNCETACHTDIRRSTAARDLNLPGIDSCRTCHAPDKDAATKVGCESCHKYHAPPATALMWRP